MEAFPKLLNFNIILLVKDKNILIQKMNNSQKEISKRYHKIMDVSNLNVYYKKLKYNLDKVDIDSFIKFSYLIMFSFIVIFK